MIEFVYLEPFYFFLLFAGLCYFIFALNLRSLNWIRENITERFQNQFTKYKTNKYFTFHILLFGAISLLLLTSSASPYFQSEVNTVDESGKIIFLIDASFSMLAGDSNTNPITKKKPYDRLAEATEFAERLIDVLPEFEYGLISFGGETAVHSNLTKDILTVKTMIHTLLGHNFEHTGTSFKKVLNKVLEISNESDSGIQVVLISDGEVPEGKKEDISEELRYLAKNGVIIHTVGVGTKEGGNVEFFISYSEEQKKEMLKEILNSDSTGTKKVQVNKKVIKTIKTHREDDLLKEISSSTSGRYWIIEKGAKPEDLVETLKKNNKTTLSKNKALGRNSLTPYFLVLFIFIFVIERLFLFRR
jgi:hypothetical protein